MAEHEVVIAGAGPTGLMLAGELALAGVNVAIAERRTQHNLVGSRAGGVTPRTIEVLDQPGIADRFLSQGYSTSPAGRPTTLNARRQPPAKSSRPESDSPGRYSHPFLDFERSGEANLQKLGEVARGVTVFDRRPKSGRCIFDVTGQRVDGQKSQLARFRTAIESRCVNAVHVESITKLDILVPGQELLNALLITTTGEGNEDATVIGHSFCSRRLQQISMGAPHPNTTGGRLLTADRGRMSSAASTTSRTLPSC
jgi:hypothetical protein